MLQLEITFFTASQDLAPSEFTEHIIRRDEGGMTVTDGVYQSFTDAGAPPHMCLLLMLL